MLHYVDHKYMLGYGELNCLYTMVTINTSYTMLTILNLYTMVVMIMFDSKVSIIVVVTLVTIILNMTTSNSLKPVVHLSVCPFVCPSVRSSGKVTVGPKGP